MSYAETETARALEAFEHEARLFVDLLGMPAHDADAMAGGRVIEVYSGTDDALFLRIAREITQRMSQRRDVRIAEREARKAGER